MSGTDTEERGGQENMKNPKFAAFLSFLFSGAGQMYNGEAKKGLVLFGIHILNILLLGVEIGMFSGFLIWLWGILDAYTSAKTMNAEATRRQRREAQATSQRASQARPSVQPRAAQNAKREETAQPRAGEAAAQARATDAAKEFRAAVEMFDRLWEAASPPREKEDAFDQMAWLSDGLLEQLNNRLGMTARPNRTFFSYRVVTAAVQRIRLDMLRGATLTEQGEQFVAQATGYLASLAVSNWQRRGLRVFGSVQFALGVTGNHLSFTAERERDGQQEVYTHRFLTDTHELLLRPPQWFPWIHSQMYAVDSLTLPPPEYLYLYGAILMQSPRAGGNWPQTQKVGGLEEDFNRSKDLLIDDLHIDCDLPLDDAELRKLSLWIVFPPYGWTMNDGQDYNMMTVFSQISHQNVVPLDVGIDYLRSLLTCQAVEIRNLAARCLMVYRIPPRDWTEAGHYAQALESGDYDMAAESMAKYQSQLEGVDTSGDSYARWREQTEQERRDWVAQPVTQPWRSAPVFSDPDYLALENLPEDRTEGIQAVEALMQRYPDDWTMRMIYGSLLMKGPQPARGEAILREQIQNPPGSAEGHLRLGTLLKYQGRREEAMTVFEDAVARWPWHHQAVDSCLWLVTDGMVREGNSEKGQAA